MVHPPPISRRSSSSHPPASHGVPESLIFFLREQTTSEFINPFLVLPLPPPSPSCAPVRLKGAHHTITMESTARNGNRRLSKDQEDIIVGVVQAFSTNNLLLSKMQIREAVANRWGIQVSEPWVRRFLCRHHLHLRTRRCKALADKRQGMEMIVNVKGFLDELTDFLKTHHFTSSSVMNFDETRIVVKGGNLTTQRVVDASKERANASSTRNSTVASLLTFAAANGSIFMSVYVLWPSLMKRAGQTSTFPSNVPPRSLVGLGPGSSRGRTQGLSTLSFSVRLLTW